MKVLGANDAGELNHLLDRLQVEFDWAERASRFALVSSWVGKGGASLHRCRGVGTGRPDVVVKEDLRWAAGTPASLFREIQDFSEILAHEGLEDVRVPRPLGWLDSPRVLCVQYVPGVDLSTVLRFPHHQLWSAPDFRVLSVVESCGRALGTYHRCNRTSADEEVAEARADLERIARRLFLAGRLASVDPEKIVVRRSYDDFGPQNLRLAEGGSVYVMDPPAHRFYRLVHKDIGKFHLELRRALEAGGRRAYPDDPRPSGNEAWEAFCRGYGASGPIDVHLADHRWLVAMFEEYRAATKVVTRMRRANLREAAQYAWAAGSKWPRLRFGYR